MLDTAESLANYLGVSKALVRKRSRDSAFPKIRIGRAIRFNREAVLGYFKALEQRRNSKEK